MKNQNIPGEFIDKVIKIINNKEAQHIVIGYGKRPGYIESCILTTDSIMAAMANVKEFKKQFKYVRLINVY